MLAYGDLCGDIAYAYWVFLAAMSASFRWSRSALSGPYGLFLIVGGMLGPTDFAWTKKGPVVLDKSCSY